MPPSFEIKPISESHAVSEFDCGDRDLNDFIKNDALKQKNEGWNTTYVATEIGSNKAIGFFALAHDAINLTPELRSKHGKEYCNIPAIKIARFAVNKTHQSKGIGKYIMGYAMGFIVQEICPKIGGIYITLDSYPQVVSWYEKHFNYRKNTLIKDNDGDLVSLIFPIKDFKVQ